MLILAQVIIVIMFGMNNPKTALYTYPCPLPSLGREAVRCKSAAAAIFILAQVIIVI